MPDNDSDTRTDPPDPTNGGPYNPATYGGVAWTGSPNQHGHMLWVAKLPYVPAVRGRMVQVTTLFVDNVPSYLAGWRFTDHLHSWTVEVHSHPTLREAQHAALTLAGVRLGPYVHRPAYIVEPAPHQVSYATLNGTSGPAKAPTGNGAPGVDPPITGHRVRYTRIPSDGTRLEKQHHFLGEGDTVQFGGVTCEARSDGFAVVAMRPVHHEGERFKGGLVKPGESIVIDGANAWLDFASDAVRYDEELSGLMRAALENPAPPARHTKPTYKLRDVDIRVDGLPLHLEGAMAIPPRDHPAWECTAGPVTASTTPAVTGHKIRRTHGQPGAGPAVRWVRDGKTTVEWLLTAAHPSLPASLDVTPTPNGFYVKTTPRLPLTLNGAPFVEGLVRPGDCLVAEGGGGIEFASDAVPFPGFPSAPAPTTLEVAAPTPVQPAGPYTGHKVRWVSCLGVAHTHGETPCPMSKTVTAYAPRHTAFGTFHCLDVTAVPGGFSVLVTSPHPITHRGEPFDGGGIRPGEYLTTDTGDRLEFAADGVPFPTGGALEGLAAPADPARADPEPLPAMRARIGAELRRRIDAAVADAAEAYMKGVLGEKATRGEAHARAHHLALIRASLPSGRWRVTTPVPSPAPTPTRE